MCTVNLYYLKTDPESRQPFLRLQTQKKWLAGLSQQKRMAIGRLVNEHDRCVSLAGLQLLKCCARDAGFDHFDLRELYYPDEGKPYWKAPAGGAFDFNITHTPGLVAVAMSSSLKVGIDVEKTRPLKRLSFKMVLNAQELEKVGQSPALFFELWSKKEAVVKAADSRGLSRMRDVHLAGEKAELDGITWYLNPLREALQAGGAYAACLASSAPPARIHVRQLSLHDLAAGPA